MTDVSAMIEQGSVGDDATRSRWLTRLATALAILAAFLTVAILRLGTAGDERFRIGLDVGSVAPVLTTALFPLVGALIVQRRPRTRVAWLMIAMGIGLGVGFVTYGYGAIGMPPPPTYPYAFEAIVISQFFMVPVLAACTTLLLLAVPDGPSARPALALGRGAVGRRVDRVHDRFDVPPGAVRRLQLPGPRQPVRPSRPVHGAVRHTLARRERGDAHGGGARCCLARRALSTRRACRAGPDPLDRTLRVVRRGSIHRGVAPARNRQRPRLGDRLRVPVVPADRHRRRRHALPAERDRPAHQSHARLRLAHSDHSRVFSPRVSVSPSGCSSKQPRRASDAAIVLATLVVAILYAPLRKRLEGVVDRRFKYEDLEFRGVPRRGHPDPRRLPAAAGELTV